MSTTIASPAGPRWGLVQLLNGPHDIGRSRPAWAALLVLTCALLAYPAIASPFQPPTSPTTCSTSRWRSGSACSGAMAGC